MSLDPGTRLGVFEVVGPLGAGGMGEVYRARDTRLGREVALKVLPEAFARDPVRVARFGREARMLASINHPSIAAIYGAEEAGDVRYIVMELVPGDTLAEWMARGPLSLEESLAFARQIAEALEAAHERGVVHRDLKPSNIKVTPDGKIKVLDLGLAKMMEEPAEETDFSNSPTMVMQDHTRPGVILGTAEFMSPEQARGKPIDKRTDIWAFGCILFEMLSGRRAFSGETVSDILASILTKDPDWEALPAYTPARIRELLSRCLEKDANQRLRDIGEARVEIEHVLAGDLALARREGRPRWGMAAALMIALAAGLTALIVARRWPPATPSGENSLVVLPAKVMGDSPESRLVGDGLVETLSVRLNQVPGIQVVTPTAAVAASDKNTDPFGAARNVGADLVVRSSVARSGDHVRIIYSVWNVRTRAQVAGDTVDGSASDLFGLQDELAARVATALKLPRPARKTPTATGLETASEQERYLQALGALQRYDQPASIDRALEILEALARERPTSPLVQAALGRAALAKFNETRDSQWTDRSAKVVARAQQLGGDTAEVEVTLGELKLRTGQPQGAAAAFQKALAMQPNSFDAVLGLARALDARGDLARAEATYKRAIGLQPSYFGGYSKLAGFYFNHGRFREAAEQFRRVTEFTPDNAKAFSNLGGTLLQLGQFEAALQAFRKSVALAPTDLAWSNIGTLEFYQGHYAAAAEADEKALALQPNHYENWANLGDARRLLPGQEPQAVQAYERSIALSRKELETNSDDAHVHSYLAFALAKTGKIAEAREHVARSLKIESRNPEILYNAAIVANRAGQRTEALSDLHRAVEAGYNPELIRRDPELADLRGEKEFQQALVAPRKTP